MWRSLLPYLASLLVVLACFLPASRAQPPGGAEGPTAAAPTGTDGPTGKEGNALPWLVAIVFTALILLVVCMPSRKN